MLRSLGTSLLAKANPGGQLRGLSERKTNTPSIPGKGAIGNLSRLGVEDPLEAQSSPGSDKVVAQRPLEQGLVGTPTDIMPEQIATAEGNRFAPVWQPSPTSPDVGSASGVGLESQLNIPSGGSNQALFQGGASNSQPLRSTNRMTQPVSRTPVNQPSSSGQVLGASTPQIPTINLQAPGLRSTPTPAQNQKVGGRTIVDNSIVGKLRSLFEKFNPLRSSNIA